MAAKTNEEIHEALLGLEPGNDEHWTADGLPRLDAVENLLGASVTRKQVTNAAPDYNRGRAQSLVDEAHDKDTAGPVDDSPDADAPEQDTDKDTAGNADYPEADPLAEGSGDEEAELDAGIDEANQRVEAIRQGLEQGKRMLEEAERDLAVATYAKNSAFPPISPAEAIQQFQRSEHQKRAAARGVPLTSLLDAALKARRNPTKRPPDFSSRG